MTNDREWMSCIRSEVTAIVKKERQTSDLNLWIAAGIIIRDYDLCFQDWQES